MRELPPLMQLALAGKQRRRRALAALPYADKVRVLLRLQQMADAIGATRGAPARSWPLDPATLLPKGTMLGPGDHPLDGDARLKP